MVDILALIQEKYTFFTKAERKVADCVLKDAHTVLKLSITDFADQCGVGDTTVFRFCRSLKLPGYQAFKMALAQSLSRAESMEIMLSEEVQRTDDLETISQKLMRAHVSILQQTYAELDYGAVQTAVGYLRNARNIYFFGIGSSWATAVEAYGRFSRVLPNIVCPMDAHMQAMTAALLCEEDVAIAFSHSGATKDTIDILRSAFEQGAKTVCMTRNPRSPITQYASVVLHCAADEGPFQGGSFSVKFSQLYLIDILYTAFFKEEYKLCGQNKSKTTQAISPKLL